MGKGEGDLQKKKTKRDSVCVYRCEGTFIGMEEAQDKQMLSVGWSQKGHWPVSTTGPPEWSGL